MFIHIHTHSDKSKRDGLSKPINIAKRVKELGQPGFFLTDHGTTSGLLESYNAVRNINKEGGNLKFGFGEEFYFCRNNMIKDRDMYHLILLAKNKKGYTNLLKLTTLANQPDNFYYKPRIDFNLLMQYHEGLIATTACMGGILAMEKVGVEEKHCDEEIIIQFKKIFGEDFYIELHTNSLKGQKEFNHQAISLAQKYDIQTVAACDSHYVYKKDAKTHRAWNFIGENDEGAYYNCDDLYLMSENEVKKALLGQEIDSGIVKESIENTVVIFEKCNVEIEFGKQHYPNFPVENQLEYLKGICREGWKEKIVPILKYNPELAQIYAERINHELDILEKANYINYFLITYDILNWCHSQGIYTGVGRGSVTASLVSFLMGITKINPVKYNLIFERFAHLERITPADIDTDVPRTRRGEVIEYIKSKYGEVYQVRTFGNMGDAASKQKARQTMRLKEDTPESLKLAKEFEGVLQNFGCHASAVVIVPGEPSEFFAIERQKDNVTGEIRYVAAYDFHDLEAMGILKQDILGLKTADVISETINKIKEDCDIDFDIDNLPENDEESFKMLREGKTSGCFQIESYGMTKLVKDIQPTSFNDMIPLVSLYRPGVLDAGMLDIYVERRRIALENNKSNI